MSLAQDTQPGTHHRARGPLFMTDKSIVERLPAHFRNWLWFAQRGPLIVMAVFSLSIIVDTPRTTGTMAIMRSNGVSQLEFSAICVIATLYVAFATRKLTLQSVVHFLLGTLPLLFYIMVALTRVFIGDLSLTAIVIYAFAYGAIMMFYWLSIALCEWELLLNLKAQAES